MPDSPYKFRLADASDAPAFADWAALNSQIDPEDLDACLKANNPTVVFFAVEDGNGKVIMFAPVYCTATLGYLGFNPEARSVERLQALETMKDGIIAFFVQFGIRELQTLTKPEYAVAKWAVSRGFEFDNRSVARLDINKEMVNHV